VGETLQGALGVRLEKIKIRLKMTSSRFDLRLDPLLETALFSFFFFPVSLPFNRFIYECTHTRLVEHP